VHRLQSCRHENTSPRHAEVPTWAVNPAATVCLPKGIFVSLFSDIHHGPVFGGHSGSELSITNGTRAWQWVQTAVCSAVLFSPPGGFLVYAANGLSGIPSLPLDIVPAYKVYLIVKPFFV